MKHKLKKLTKKLLIYTLTAFLFFSNSLTSLASVWGILGMSGSDSGAAGGTAAGIWEWSTDSGYKITTYLLATTSLNYMLDLNPELKQYIVDSRPGMLAFQMGDDNSADTLIEKYVQAANYTNRETKSYIADSFQQLGRPFLVETSYAEYDGYMISRTSPDKHLSTVDLSTSTEEIVAQTRTDVEIKPIVHMATDVKTNGGERVTYLGNTIYNNKFDITIDGIYEFDGSLNKGTYMPLEVTWLKDLLCFENTLPDKYQGAGWTGTSNLGDVMTYAGSYVAAIYGAIWAGMCEDGVDVTGLGDSSITGVHRVLEIHEGDFKSASGEGLISGDNVIGIKVEGSDTLITTTRDELYSTFLKKYTLNGTSYTFSDVGMTPLINGILDGSIDYMSVGPDLDASSGTSENIAGDFRTWGLAQSIVVVYEPVTATALCDSTFQTSAVQSNTALFWGEYADVAVNQPKIHRDNKRYEWGATNVRSFMVSIGDIAYWFGTNRDNVSSSDVNADKGVSGFRHIQGIVSDIASGARYQALLASEKYSAGMVFNTTLSDGFAIDDYNKSPAWALNTNTYALSPYAEFTTVQRRSLSSASGQPQNCLNIDITSYFDCLPTNYSYPPHLAQWTNGSWYGKKEVVGGITYRALIPSTTTQEIRQYSPFPVVAVRHIDKSLQEASSGATNPLLRDTITWTVPLSLGLAIEDDFAKAALLAESGALLEAMGLDGGASVTSVQSSVSSYSGGEISYGAVQKMLTVNPSLKERWGGDVSGLYEALRSKTYDYNGVSVKTMSIGDIIKPFIEEVTETMSEDFDGSKIEELGSNQEDLFQRILLAEAGDVGSQEIIESYLMDNVVEYYKKYSIRIPLLSNSETLKEDLPALDSNEFYAVPAKPLTEYGGNLEYTDGVVEGSGANTELLRTLNSYKDGSAWDTIENYKYSLTDTDTYFGSTGYWVNTKLVYPASRVLTTLEVGERTGSAWSLNISLNKDNKKQYYYGFNFTPQREQSFYQTTIAATDNLASSLGIKNNTTIKNYIDAFTYLKVSKTDGTYRSYVPTARMYRNYADYAYDIGLFAGKLSYEDLASDYESVVDVYNSADPTKTSQWIYRVVPESSLGLKSLSSNKSVSSNVLADDYLGYASGSGSVLKSVGSMESSVGLRPAAYQYGTKWKWKDIIIRSNWLGTGGSTGAGSNETAFNDLSDDTGVVIADATSERNTTETTEQGSTAQGSTAQKSTEQKSIAQGSTESESTESGNVETKNIFAQIGEDIWNSLTDLAQGFVTGFVAYADATTSQTGTKNGISESSFKLCMNMLLYGPRVQYGDLQQTYEYATKTCMQYYGVGRDALWEMIKTSISSSAAIHERIYNKVYLNSQNVSTPEELTPVITPNEQVIVDKVQEAAKDVITSNPTMSTDEYYATLIDIIKSIVFQQNEDEAGTSVDVNAGKSEYRAFNSVWVADNGNYTVNNGQLSNGGDQVSASTTVAFYDMYNTFAENDVYDVSLVYQPEISALEGWMYRRYSSYEDTALKVDALNANGIGTSHADLDIADTIRKNKNTTVATDKLDDGRELITTISRLNEIQTLDANTGIGMEWTAVDGWSLFSRDNQLLNITGTAEPQIYKLSGDEWSPKLNYITLNVASMLIYGDLGTIDAYYSTTRQPEIIDIEIEVTPKYPGTTTSVDTSAIRLSDLIANPALIVDKCIANVWEIEAPPSTRYDMENECNNRGYVPSGDYVQTIIIRKDTLEELEKTTETIEELYLELTKQPPASEPYFEDLGKVDFVNLDEEIKQELDKQIVFVNIWVYKETLPVDLGDHIIRKDEICAAQIVEVPAYDIVFLQTGAPQEVRCSDFPPESELSPRNPSYVGSPYNGPNLYFSPQPTPSYFTVHPSNSMATPQTWYESTCVLSDPYTIVGTGSRGDVNWYPKLRMRWESSMKTMSTVRNDYSITWQEAKSTYFPDLDWLVYETNAKGQGNTQSGFLYEYPQSQLYITMIAHRSGHVGDGSTCSTVSKTPPLAAYMNVTNENTKFLTFAGDSSMPVESVWEATRITNSRYGYSRATNSLGVYQQTIKFKKGDMSQNADQDVDTQPDFYTEHRHWWQTFHDYEHDVITGYYCDGSCDSPDTCTDCTPIWDRVTETIACKCPFSGLPLNAAHSEIKIETTAYSKTLLYHIFVENTYIAKLPTTTRTLDAIVKVKRDALNSNREMYDYGGEYGQDRYVEYYIPTKLSFYPTYQMRADYVEDAYEIDGQKQVTPDTAGDDDREIVWTLGKNMRNYVVYDFHNIAFEGDAKTEILAPWSKDKQDKDETAKEGDTVKAGGAIKAKDNQASIKVTSIISLIDPKFVENEALQKQENLAKLNEHNYLVDKVLSMGNDLRSTDNYAFLYSSLPGGYDVEMVADGHREFYNEFQNYINGYIQYPDDIMNGTTPHLEQTALKLSKHIANIDGNTTVHAYYLNKEFEDSDYTNGNARTRTFNVQMDAVGLAPAMSTTVVPELYNGANYSVDGRTIEELIGAQAELDSILERAQGSHWNWYKEDYEGIVIVVLETTININLEGDYSIVWSKLSDWLDLDEVEPYTDPRPNLTYATMGTIQQELINGGTVPNGTNIAGASNRIPPGAVGVGYGLLSGDVTLRDISFGKLVMLYEPYKFRVRAIITDDINR